MALTLLKGIPFFSRTGEYCWLGPFHTHWKKSETQCPHGRNDPNRVDTQVIKKNRCAPKKGTWFDFSYFSFPFRLFFFLLPKLISLEEFRRKKYNTQIRFWILLWRRNQADPMTEHTNDRKNVPWTGPQEERWEFRPTHEETKMLNEC